MSDLIPGSPQWWLERLGKELAAKQSRLKHLDRYLQGDPPLPESAENCREAYKAFQRRSRTNYAELIVEAVSNRMRPVGFRSVGPDGSATLDTAAWRIWQANSLDADAPGLHKTMLGLAESYALIGPVEADTGEPLITCESPYQVITDHDPKRKRKVRSGLKVFEDDITGDATELAYVYLPDNGGQVYRAHRVKSQLHRFSAGDWQWEKVDEGGNPEGESLRLPFDVVPVVRYANQDFVNPIGEFERYTDHLDRINLGILQRMIVAVMQAYRQRGVKGMPERDPEGNEIDYDSIFAPGPGALWLLPPEGEIWESATSDITPLLLSVKDDVRDLAAVTRTPINYLSPESANQSAAGADNAKEAHVAKAYDRIGQTSESHELTMSISFGYKGEVRRPMDLETVWIPPELHSLSERADAASKDKDMPWRSRMEKIWQFSPQEIDRMEAERAAEELRAAALAQQFGTPAPGQPNQDAEETPNGGESES